MAERAVRMKHSMQGVRLAQQVPWPPYNGILRTNAEEAELLVNAGWAVYLEDEPEAVHEGYKAIMPLIDGYVEPAAIPRHEELAEPVTAVGEVSGKEYTFGDPAEVKRPYTNARKDVWIDYAISQGEDEMTAGNMSKEDLIQKWGASI
jgi:hypothetical protein